MLLPLEAKVKYPLKEKTKNRFYFLNYNCIKIPVTKLELTHQGFIQSLCDTCKTVDCTNPIEVKRISILGITKEMRVFSRGDDASFVVNCEGYNL